MGDGIVQDNELIASFEPRLKGYVLVLAFDDIEDMLLQQERIQALFRNTRDDEGKPLPQVETLWMGQSQYGERSLMSGQVRVGALVSSEAGLVEVQNARKEWAQNRMMTTTTLPSKQGTAEPWRANTEQMDMIVKWAQDVLEPHPAGNTDGTPRIKSGIAREGYNWFCLDHDRPELRLEGVPGGKAFSGALQSIFPKELRVDRLGNNVYFYGLRRKQGANPKHFKRP
jgi:hypothetical protein